MSLLPIRSNSSARHDNRSEATALPDTRQGKRSGADRPDERTGYDNSRAVPSHHVGLLPDGRLRVSRDIQQLLTLDRNVVDLGATSDEAEDDAVIDDDNDTAWIGAKSAFAEPAAERPADVAAAKATAGPAIDPNIPPSSYRFLTMSLPALLQEVADWAIGEGPPDPVVHPPSTTLPETRRLGDMVWALQYQPGRQHDAQVLRNAGRALSDFFPVYRRLVDTVRESRPDLGWMLPEWTADLVREPLRKALEMPLGPDGEPSFDSGRSAELRQSVERPYDLQVAELDARMSERRRFSNLPLLALLDEAAQRAIGNGPPDTRPPTDVATSPEAYRLGQMVRALQAEPGRAGDAVHLRNAGRLLKTFFSEMRALMQDIKTRRPDLAPHLALWSAEMVRPALQRALDAPGVRDAGYRVDELLGWDIAKLCQRPLDVYMASLGRRALADKDPRFLGAFSAFFERMTRPRTPGVFLENSLQGAGINEREGADVKRLLDGSIVFQGKAGQLAANLQWVPAGVMVETYNRNRSPGADSWLEARKQARYPQRADGNSIREVAWLGPEGITLRVFVTERRGVHSYSADEGASWAPTGGPSGAAANAARAERWAEFLIERRAQVGAGAGR